MPCPQQQPLLASAATPLALARVGQRRMGRHRRGWTLFQGHVRGKAVCEQTGLGWGRAGGLLAGRPLNRSDCVPTALPCRASVSLQQQPLGLCANMFSSDDTTPPLRHQHLIPPHYHHHHHTPASLSHTHSRTHAFPFTAGIRQRHQRHSHAAEHALRYGRLRVPLGARPNWRFVTLYGRLRVSLAFNDGERGTTGA